MSKDRCDEDTSCDACGRDLKMTYPDPITKQEVTGIAPAMEMCLHLGPLPEVIVQDVYPELILNHHYRVCMVCALKSLGVKIEYSRTGQADRGSSGSTGRVT